MRHCSLVRRFLVFAILVVTTITSALAQNYYVATSGSDSNSGLTTGSAWRTLAHALAVVPANSGSTINIGSGTFTESGSSYLPPGVSIAGAGKASTIISFSSNSLITTNPDNTIVNGNQTIRDLSFDGQNRVGNTALWLRARNNISVLRVGFTNIQSMALLIWNQYEAVAKPTEDTYLTGVEIGYCTFTDCGSAPFGDVVIGGVDGMLFHDNVINNTNPNTYFGVKYNPNGPIGGGWFKNCKFYNNQITVTPSNATYELWNVWGGNEIYNDTLNEWISLVGGNKGTSTYSIRIHNSTLNKTTGVHPYGIEAAVSDAEIDHNYFFNLGEYSVYSAGTGNPNSDSGLFAPRSHNLVHHNVFDNSSGLSTQGRMLMITGSSSIPSDGCQVYNNLGINIRFGAYLQNDHITNFRIANNIFVGISDHVLATQATAGTGSTFTGLVLNNNVKDTGGNTTSDWVVNYQDLTTPTLTANQVGNPGLTNAGAKPDPYYVPASALSLVVDAGSLSGLATFTQLSTQQTIGSGPGLATSNTYAGNGPDIGPFEDLSGFAGVAAPVFNPSAGTYNNSQSVTITSATSGASIRYTTDGSTPTPTSGTVYTSPVPINATTTLKAIAYTSTSTFSSVTTGVYTITVGAPVFSPTPGTYSNSQSVTITSPTTGASIRYTTDGTTPTSTTGTLYSSAINITSTTMLKAIAYTSASNVSTVTSGTYTITVAAPAFAPGGGTYSSAQTVTLTTSTSGATIRFTTDGSTPTTTTGTIYSGPIGVSTNTTINALAYLSASSVSTVSSATYNFVTAAPVFTPTPGQYATTQSVTITSTTPGASIRYTIDGSTPTSTSGTIYTGPISVSASVTLTAVAYASGWTTSAPTIGAYTIGTPTDILTGLNARWKFDEGSGTVANDSVGTSHGSFVGNATWTSASKVGPFALNFNGNSYVGVPNTASLNPTNAITLSFWVNPTSLANTWSSTTFLMKADYGYQTTYAVTGNVSSTSFGIPGVGNVTANTGLPLNAWTFVTVTYDNATGKLLLYLNGTLQATTTVSPGLNIGSNGNGLRIGSGEGSGSVAGTMDDVRLYGRALTASEIATVMLVTSSGPTQTAAPTFSPVGGTYTSAQTVTIASATSGASIRYTTDGSSPTSTTGTLYSGPISVATTQTVKAIAFASGKTDSTVSTATYTINLVAATPTFTPAPGSYATAQTVSLATTTAGASIRYTTDGSTPTNVTGTLYTTPISVTSTTSIKAIAYASGYANSSVATGVYTISPVVVAPAFSPAPGSYASAQTVTISSTTSGASIRYTTDGSTPTSTTGTLYSGPVTISATTTLKAIAYASGMTDSSVTSGVYTIGATDITNGLVARWKFDESTGTTAADSAGSSTGNLNGSPTWTTSAVVGSHALTFNGNNYVLVPNTAALNPTSAITLSFWVNPTSLSPSWANTTFLMKADYGYQTTYSVSGNTAGMSFGLPGVGTVTTSAAPALNTWTLVTATYDSATGKLILYLNGVQQGISTVGTGLSIGTNGNGLRIGSGEGSGSVVGTMDDVRIYNRALSASEIVTVYGVRN